MKYFIYYSLTGNGDYLAELLKDKGYEPVRVTTVKPIGKPGFFRILHHGGKAMLNAKRKINPLSIELKENDEVIIGSPIWNDRFSTPINDLLSKYSFNKETTKFIVYPAGEKAKTVQKQIKKLGFKNEALVISYPIKKQEQAKELINKI